MTKTAFATIVGISALAVLAVFVGWVSAQQTGATVPAAQDVVVQSLASGTAPLANFLLVRGMHGRGHSGFRLYLGYGWPGYYYGYYPYGYGTGYSVAPGEPICVWNGYKYTCYDASSGRAED